MAIELPQTGDTAELSETEKQKGVLDLTLESERDDPLITFHPDVIDRRTQMAIYSMDKLSDNDYNNYSHKIASGQEQQQRQMDAREDGLRSRMITDAAIKEFAETKNRAVTPEEAQALQMLAQEQVHPDAPMSVWERKYAERVLNDALNTETYVEAMGKDPDTVNGAQDIGNEVIQKNMMFKNVWEKFEAKHQEEDGWFETIGKNIRGVMPFADHYIISKAGREAGADLSLSVALWGKTTTELMDDLWATPLVDGAFEQKLESILEGLYERSPISGQEFGHLFMEGYGHGSETFRNAVSLLDLTLFPSLARLTVAGGKGLVRLVKPNSHTTTVVKANGPQYKGTTVNGIKFHAVQSPKKASRTKRQVVVDIERTEHEQASRLARMGDPEKMAKYAKSKGISTEQMDDLTRTNHANNVEELARLKKELENAAENPDTSGIVFKDIDDDAVAGTIEQIAQVTEAVARGAPPAEVAQAGGSFLQAAILHANEIMGKVGARAGDARVSRDAARAVAALASDTTTLTDVWSVMRGASPKFRASLGEHLTEKLPRAVAFLTDPSSIRVATEGALQYAFEETAGLLRRAIIESNDNIATTAIGHHAQITDARWGQRLTTKTGQKVQTVKNVGSDATAGGNPFVELFMVNERGFPWASHKKASTYADDYNYAYQDIIEIAKDQFVVVFRKDVNMKDPKLIEALFVRTGKEEVGLNAGIWGTWGKHLAGFHEQLGPGLIKKNFQYVTHKGTQESAILTEFVNDLNTLPAKSQKKLSEFTNDRQAMADALEPDRLGDYARNQGDLETKWRDYHQVEITKEETNAYWSFVMLNDMDFVRRNLGMHRALVRQGVEQVSVPLWFNRTAADGQDILEQGVRVQGVVLDDIPLNDARLDTFKVLEVDAKGQAGRVWTRESLEEGTGEAGEGLARMRELIRDGKARVVQVANPSGRPFHAVPGAEDHEINFVVTKLGTRKPLGFDIFPYRRGGHREDTATFRSKQALYTQSRHLGDARSALVEGDTTIFGWNSKAKAEKYNVELNKGIALIRLEKEEAAELLTKGKDPTAGLVDPQVLDDFIKNSFLPETPSEFRAYFEPTPLKRKPPKVRMDYETARSAIHGEFTGQTGAPAKMGAPRLSWADDLHIIEDGGTIIGKKSFNDELARKGLTLVDRRNSAWNLYAGVPKTYAGRREDKLVQTIAEKWDEAGVLTAKVEPMERHNPLSVSARGAQRLIRGGTLELAKIQTAEQFVETVARMTGDKAEAALHRLDPVNTLNVFDPMTMTDVSLGDRLRLVNIQQATRALMGTKTVLGVAVDALMSKLYSMTYQRFGDEAVKRISRLELERTRDPVRFARGMAFHYKLGMLNPLQPFLQGQSFAIAGAISPRHAPTSWAHQYFQRFLKVNSSPEIVADQARKAAKFGGTEKEFIEAWQLQVKNGWDKIGGEHALIDSSGDPRIWQGKFTKTINKAGFFFFEIESALRRSAFHIAYREFRVANPKKLITNVEELDILSRAKTLQVNMSREASARWQQGIFSTMTQFWGYQGRVMDLTLGSSLTWQEKARVMGANSVLYGIPTGILGTAFGVWPWMDEFREAMINNDINPDDGMIGLLQNGIVEGMLKTMGLDNNYGDRLGPKGIDTIKNLWLGLGGEGGSLVEIMGGASASILGQIINDTLPLRAVVSSWFSQDQEGLTLAPRDFIQIANNISSFSSAHKIYGAINTGRYINTNGDQMGEFSGWQAVIRAFTGLEPHEIGDIYAMRLTLKQERAIKNDYTQLGIREFTQYLHEYTGGKTSHEEMQNTIKRAKSFLISGGVKPSEHGAILKRAIEQDGADVYVQTVIKFYEDALYNSNRDKAQQRQNRGEEIISPLQNRN